MAALAALARTRYALPLGGLTAKRSLLALDNLVSAVVHVLELPEPLHRPFIVADPQPVTVGQMIAAMRTAMGTSPGLFPVPGWMLKMMLIAGGRTEWVDRLCSPWWPAARHCRPKAVPSRSHSGRPSGTGTVISNLHYLTVMQSASGAYRALLTAGGTHRPSSASALGP